MNGRLYDKDLSEIVHFFTQIIFSNNWLDVCVGLRTEEVKLNFFDRNFISKKICDPAR